MSNKTTRERRIEKIKIPSNAGYFSLSMIKLDESQQETGEPVCLEDVSTYLVKCWFTGFLRQIPFSYILLGMFSIWCRDLYNEYKVLSRYLIFTACYVDIILNWNRVDCKRFAKLPSNILTQNRRFLFE